MCRGSAAISRQTPVFSRFRLPHGREITASSIKGFVEKIGFFVDFFIDSSSEEWAFHLATPDDLVADGDLYIAINARAKLINESFLNRMHSYRRRAMERFREIKALQPFPGKIFIRGLLIKRNTLWLSAWEIPSIKVQKGLPRDLIILSRDIVPDFQAPNRSYLKIEEAWLEAGIFPKTGETCVDLGAAPGGWTWSALKRGARVTAVDSADLASHIEVHPHCKHVRENGFTYMPPDSVDWMFCDMIVKPMATLGLIDRWLEAEACRNFVVNVKFRGKDPTSIFEAIALLVRRYELRNLMVRHLFYDKNEITLIFIR